MYAPFFKQRSDMSHSEEQAPYTLFMPRSLSKDPHTVYASFFKQISDISQAKEQARGTLCVYRY